MDDFVHALASHSRFYRSRLAEADRRRYDSILSGMQTFQESVCVPLSSGVRSVSDLLHFVRLDNPELFYVDFGKMRIARWPAYTKLFISYMYEPSQARSKGEKLAARIAEIFDAAGVSKLSPYGRELFFHDFLHTRITYEHKDSGYYKSHSVEGALLHGRAVCEGYAKAFKLLCDKAGLSALVVFGTAAPRTGVMEDHAWNIVKLHGQCYHVDVTWDHGMAVLEGEINHTYFNTTDRKISYSHAWDQELLPACTSTEYSYYEKNELVFPDTTGLIQYFAEHIRAGELLFCVKTDPRTQSRDTVSSAFRAALLKCPRKRSAMAYQICYDEAHGVASIRIKP